MDKEMEEFQASLLRSVQDMKAGKAGRVTQVKLSSVTDVRAKVGVSQSLFAALLGVSVRTLQDWEQGRREPSGAAKTLIQVASAHPEVLRELLPS